MNKVLFLFCLLSLTALTASGQTTWYPVDSDTQEHLLCIDFASPLIGYAAGEDVIVKTTDGGHTWIEVQVDSMASWNDESWLAQDIQFFDALHGRMVLGQWQGMVETFDGGLTWSQFTPLSAGFCQFGSLYFFDAERGMTGGAGCFESAIIDLYTDGEWSLTDIPGTFDTSDLVTNFDFINDTLGLACTAIGRILRTEDGGLSWDTMPNPELGSVITDIAYLDANTAYATYERLGGFGTMISLDGGLNWDADMETATFYYPQMSAVHVNGVGTAFMAGLSESGITPGVIFDKSNGFWSFQSLEHPIKDIASSNDSITFLVGDNGAMYSNVDPMVLSLDELNQNIQVQIYPNPAADWVNVSVDARDYEITDVRLYDMGGKQIAVEFSTSDYDIPVQLEHIPAGRYMLEILTDKGRNTAVFVKN